MKRLMMLLFLLFAFHIFAATKTFTGTGNFNDSARWDGGTLPSAGDDLVINGDCTMTADEATTYGSCDVQNTYTLDQSTYNLTVSGLFQVDSGGTWDAGSSGGTGLTCGSFDLDSGASGTRADDTLVNCSGDIIKGAGNGDCTLTITGSGNYSGDGGWHSLTQNAGVTTTLTAGSSVGKNASDGTYIINGIFAAGSYVIRLGGASGITFGANADITGTGELQWGVVNTTYTNNKVGTFTFSGTINVIWGASRMIPTGDWSNADVAPDFRTAGDTTLYFSSGTLKCKDFALSAPSGRTVTVYNDTNNPNFEISGDIDFDIGDGSTTWTKGTGTITLTGSSGTQTITMEDSLEDLVINCSGATKEFTSNLTMDSFTPTAGTAQSSVGGTARTFTFSATSSGAGTIKDIYCSQANRVNCKAGTNQGNTKGIVFVDTIKQGE